MRVKKVLWIAGTLAAVILLLLFCQALVVPKYTDVPEGALIREYYPQAGDHDVVFVGDCEVYENISPVTLWNEYGISSYIRGSAQQLIWQSYYLMEDTFRYETPKVMVFNVLSMKYDTPQSTGQSSQREAYNRMTLDGMRWSAAKWNAIEASMTDEERDKSAMWTYLIPLLRYHDRWSELKWDDVRYLLSRPPVSDSGYLMQVGVRPVTGEYPQKPLADYQFSDTCYGYLDKMLELCKSHGTELVLIKAPSLSPVWYDEWEEQIETYAAEHDLRYYNFLEKQEAIGVDWRKDTYDRGLHLNVYGAEKLAHYFGNILRSDCKVPDRRQNPEYVARWETITEAYNARKTELEAAYEAETK